MTIKTLAAMAVSLVCVCLTACDGENGSADKDNPPSSNDGTGFLSVLSNRADLISGGDVLIEVAAESAPTVKRNGEDVSDLFEVHPSGTYRALVTGLVDGENSITAITERGSASVTVVNHPNGGPVFSGPQLEPWQCNNAGATDAHCNQDPVYTFHYKSSNPLMLGLQTYDPANPPTDVAQVTTDNGETVPYIVRREVGFQDRDEYRIAVLYQPDQPWTAANPQPQFNGKVVIEHGASCGTDYGSGTATAVLPSGAPSSIEEALARGYVVASTALNNSGHNCNVALQAESIVMVKERIIEQYGDLRYTIGEGCSGGSLAIQWMANAYPGLFQGILPTCSFPDAWSTATQFLDYHLTIDYFFNPSRWGAGILWEPNQMAAVQGHITLINSQVSDLAQFSVAVPTTGCNNAATDDAYDPDTNPDGVRCAIQDAAINVFGARPEELWSEMEQAVGYGFAGFPVDNVGVQYGLIPLQDGMITPAQFLDINERIGGLDVDTNIIPERLKAVEPALSNAYRSGMINSANNLDQVAIIDCRGPDPGLFHDAYRAYAVRARLDREHGHHDNQLIWEGPVPLLGDAECGRLSFLAMDRWLAAVEADSSDTSLAERIVSAKPSDLSDACLSGLGQTLLDTTCGQAVVGVYGTPRTAAGDAITTDRNKCQLKPLSRSDDYGPIGFSDAEWQRMETLFSSGVCDFSVPGVSQQGTVPWLVYQDATGKAVYGGTQLPEAPSNSGSAWASPAFFEFW